MLLAIGADDAGYPLKKIIREYLNTRPEIELVDFGVNESDPEYYPDIAERVAVAIAKGEMERGILICGTGIGMAITACKVPGIRAALCHDTYSAERARKSNDAQILTMGARVIGPELAKKIVQVWLESEFAGEGSAPKVQRIKDIEHKYLTEHEP